MDTNKIRQKANNEIELMQGCMPSIGGLPEDKDELYKELKKLARILHDTGKYLNNYAELLNKNK